MAATLTDATWSALETHVRNTAETLLAYAPYDADLLRAHVTSQAVNFDSHQIIATELATTDPELIAIIAAEERETRDARATAARLVAAHQPSGAVELPEFKAASKVVQRASRTAQAARAAFFESWYAANQERINAIVESVLADFAARHANGEHVSDVYTLDEAAALLHMQPRSLRTAYEQGRIDRSYTSLGTLFTRHEIERYRNAERHAGGRPRAT